MSAWRDFWSGFAGRATGRQFARARDRRVLVAVQKQCEVLECQNDDLWLRIWQQTDAVEAARAQLAHYEELKAHLGPMAKENAYLRLRIDGKLPG